MSMFKTHRNSPSAPEHDDRPPVDVTTEHLSQWLFTWMQHNQRTTLPKPLPYTATEAAGWFAQTFCPPPPPAPASGDKWAMDHAGRERSAHLTSCRSSLRGYLCLTDQQRQGVLDIITEGAFPLTYRGDSFQFFVEVASWADVASADPETFKRATLERARHAGRAHVRACA